MSTTETSPVTTRTEEKIPLSSLMPPQSEDSTNTLESLLNTYKQPRETLTLLFFGSIAIKKEKIFAMKCLIFAKEIFLHLRCKECSEPNFLQLQRKISRRHFNSLIKAQTTTKVFQWTPGKSWILKSELLFQDFRHIVLVLC